MTLVTLDRVQERLFDDQRAEIDDDHDPYALSRKSADRLAAEYKVSVDEALELIFSRGSEWAARQALDQRWWMDDQAQAA